MSESSMRTRVVKALKRLHAFAVENPAWPGTPDVNYREGWLELKELPEWPVREDTVVPLPHFTPQQRIFLTRRSHAGGQVYMLLKVRQDWYLIEGAVAATIVGKTATRKDIENNSVRTWRGRAFDTEVAECLSSLQN